TQISTATLAVDDGRDRSLDDHWNLPAPPSDDSRTDQDLNAPTDMTTGPAAGDNDLISTASVQERESDESSLVTLDDGCERSHDMPAPVSSDGEVVASDSSDVEFSCSSQAADAEMSAAAAPSTASDDGISSAAAASSSASLDSNASTCSGAGD